jgi:hypothetical protein
MPQHDLVARFMHARLEVETSTLIGALDSPSREDLGHFGDIFL